MVFLLEMICDVNYIPLLFSRQRKGEAREARVPVKEGGETLPQGTMYIVLYAGSYLNKR